MRVFRNREAAEAEGFREIIGYHSDRGYYERINERAVVRSPLENKLFEALEAVEWGGSGGDCPSCGGGREYIRRSRSYNAPRHAPDCKLSAALRAFRGEDLPPQTMERKS